MLKTAGRDKAVFFCGIFWIFARFVKGACDRAVRTVDVRLNRILTSVGAFIGAITSAEKLRLLCGVDAWMNMICTY